MSYLNIDNLPAVCAIIVIVVGAIVALGTLMREVNKIRADALKAADDAIDLWREKSQAQDNKIASQDTEISQLKSDLSKQQDHTKECEEKYADLSRKMDAVEKFMAGTLVTPPWLEAMAAVGQRNFNEIQKVGAQIETGLSEILTLLKPA